MSKAYEKVFVTGGGGYVGSVLVPELLYAGYQVNVIDMEIFGVTLPSHPNLTVYRGDMREKDIFVAALDGCSAMIHLAAVTNDQSCELDPVMCKSINFDCFEWIVDTAKEMGVKYFVFASSSSVYGLKTEEEVTEDCSLEPITDYSRYKAICEGILTQKQGKDFHTTIIRPATVCGYSPRMRLDLVVNALTNHAVNTGVIKVFGGAQKRPNIHIYDMVDLYQTLLELPVERVSGKTWNAGKENFTISETAEKVKTVVERQLRRHVEIITTPSDDIRSYYVNSDRIARDIGFYPCLTVEDAVIGMVKAHKEGKIPDAMKDSRYFNLKRMKEMGVK